MNIYYVFGCDLCCSEICLQDSENGDKGGKEEEEDGSDLGMVKKQ
jgi:hypothetical protein